MSRIVIYEEQRMLMWNPVYEYLEHWQQQHLDQKSGEVDRLAQIEDYLLREVPKRLRQALTCELDHDLNVVEEDLRRKTRSLLKDVLNEVRRPNSRQERTMGATVLSSSGVPEPKATFHALSEDIGNGSGSTSGLLPHHMRPGLPPDEFDVDAFFTSLEEAETAQAGADQTTSAATEGSSFDLEPTYYPDPFHLLGNPELGLDGGGLIENLLQGRKTQKDSAYGSNESDDTKCI
jgi:hypothetical protein